LKFSIDQYFSISIRNFGKKIDFTDYFLVESFDWDSVPKVLSIIRKKRAFIRIHNSNTTKFLKNISKYLENLGLK
jgi:hypothetical protein